MTSQDRNINIPRLITNSEFAGMSSLDFIFCIFTPPGAAFVAVVVVLVGSIVRSESSSTD